jgi:hypothetical protein
MHIGIVNASTINWITPIQINTFFGPSLSTHSVTKKLNTMPWQMFLTKLSVTNASLANSL